MTIVVGNGPDDLSSNPGQGVYITFNANTFAKGMNPTILLLAMGKY